jgi:hypothetical protein
MLRRIDRIEYLVAGTLGGLGLLSLVLARRPFVSFVLFALAVTWLSALLARRTPLAAHMFKRLFLLPPADCEPTIDRMAVVGWCGIVVAQAVLMAPAWRNPPPLSPLYDDHEWTSLNIAVVRARCGAMSAVPDGDVAAELSRRPGDVRTPIMEFATFSCATVRPLVISQNSLMLVEAAILRLKPTASLATIARVLIALQFVSMTLFVTALIAKGMPILATGVLAFGVVRFTEALMGQYAYAVYPLVVPSMLALIGALTLASFRSWQVLSAVGFCIGMAIGAIGGLRTDMLPICFVLVFIWLLMNTRVAVVFALAATALVAGVFVFNLTWIRPIEQAQPGRLTGHPIMHPLVLGLATPENAFARRMGIAWDDAAGFDLAHHIQPGVNVLTHEYEAVLRRFYFDLWRTQPRNMLAIYRLKFAAAARSFIAHNTGVGFDSQLWRGLLRPLGAPDSSGWRVPLFYAVGALGGLALLRHRIRSWVAPLTLVIVGGALNWLESVLIFSRFSPQYYGLAFIGVVTCCLLLYQFVWQLAAWPLVRALPGCPGDSEHQEA